MEQTKLEKQIAAFASLSDPTRRRLYVFVTSQPDGAGREEAAEAVGISRALAAFHLDRLVADDLLVAGYRRLSGRSGPGAGRPAKIYRRSGRELALSLPQRNYELLARLLARALTGNHEASSAETLRDAARELGVTLGAQARRDAGPRAGQARLLAAAVEVLNDCGFEASVREGAGLRLHNCPFSPLSREFTDLVCGMNLDLMQGLVDGLRLKGIEAELDPKPGRCCVVFRPHTSASTGAAPKRAQATR